MNTGKLLKLSFAIACQTCHHSPAIHAIDRLGQKTKFDQAVDQLGRGMVPDDEKLGQVAN